MKRAPPLLSALGVLGLLLAGCAETGPTASGDSDAAGAAPPDTPTSAVATAPEPASPAPTDCNASAAQPFVGQIADEATRARLLDSVGPVGAVRWVGPGDATTEDYSPARLNVMLDAGGRIASAHCG